MIEGHSSTKEQTYQTGKESDQLTIDMLPDVALLRIFDFYMNQDQTEAWYTLVHVCREWRNIVFGSPRRLGVRLLCTARTRVQEMLDVWPRLPIAVEAERGGVKRIYAAFEHRDCICQVQLSEIQPSEWENVLAAMRLPFPALTNLELHLDRLDQSVQIDPSSFLDVSAPHLRTLRLVDIPFSGLPKFLSCATHLVGLFLHHIPDSAYISPEVMVACPSALTNLDTLEIGFQCLQGRQDNRLLSPPTTLQTRTLLPVLTKLQFRGDGKYLENFVARIDAPLLDKLHITFFHWSTLSAPVTRQLTQFIGRTPKFHGHDRARVIFDSGWDYWVTLVQTFDERLSLGILSLGPDFPLSSLAQLCSSSFPHAGVEHLHIVEAGNGSCWQIDPATIPWLVLFHPFPAVKHLYLSQHFTRTIVPALQELIGERETEVLPALRTLFLEQISLSGPVDEAAAKFVAARQLGSHPVVISPWRNGEYIRKVKAGVYSKERKTRRIGAITIGARIIKKVWKDSKRRSNSSCSDSSSDSSCPDSSFGA